MRAFAIVTILGSTILSVAAVADEASFSFALDAVDGPKVSLTCDQGCDWDRVSYSGGAFYVTQDGVETAVANAKGARVSGLIIERNETAAALDVSCNAPRCTITRESDELDLQREQNTRVDTGPHLAFTVWNAPSPASDGNETRIRGLVCQGEHLEVHTAANAERLMKACKKPVFGARIEIQGPRGVVLSAMTGKDGAFDLETSLLPPGEKGAIIFGGAARGLQVNGLIEPRTENVILARLPESLCSNLN